MYEQLSTCFSWQELRQKLLPKDKRKKKPVQKEEQKKSSRRKQGGFLEQHSPASTNKSISKTEKSPPKKSPLGAN
jgi:hypothetical protein